MVLSAARSRSPPMTARRPCPPAPGPLEDYAARFDDLFASLAQRRGFREYLQGLLLPRDRNKTLTGLAGAEPVIGAQHRRSSGCSGSCRSRPGTPSRSTTGGWSCCARTRRPPRTSDGVLVHRRHRRPQGRHRDRARRPPVPRLGRQDRQRHRRRHQPVGRRALLLPAARVPYTPATRLPGGKRDPASAPSRSWPSSWSRPPAGRDPVPGGGGRLPLRRQPRLHRRAGRRQGPVRAGPQAPQGHLGAGRGAHTPDEAAGELGWGGPAKPGRWRRWCAASATATARPGGRPTPSLAAGARTGRCGWWWPRPTRPGCPGTAPGIC